MTPTVEIKIDGVVFILNVDKIYHKHEDTVSVTAYVQVIDRHKKLNNALHQTTWIEPNDD